MACCQEKVIVTLAITILIESAGIIGYAHWRKRHLTHLILFARFLPARLG
jgi:hypothetical protein